MAIQELSNADEAPSRSGGWSQDRHSATKTRIFISDDWFNAEKEAPQMGDAHPSNPAFKVSAVQGIPWGAPLDWADPIGYEKCLIVVTYSNTALENEGEVLLQEEDATEVLEVGGGRRWVSDGSWVDQPLTIMYPMTIITITQCRVIRPIDGYWDCLGRVNQYAWLPPTYDKTCPPGTALCLPWQCERQYDPVTTLRWKIIFKFLIDVRGHNYRWRIKSEAEGLWDTTNPPLRQSADFAKLLQLGT